MLHFQGISYALVLFLKVVFGQLYVDCLKVEYQILDWKSLFPPALYSIVFSLLFSTLFNFVSYKAPEWWYMK